MKNHPNSIRSLGPGLLLGLILPSASAQGVLPEGAWTQVEDAQLNTADAHAHFWTGRHVDVDGDTLIVSGGLGGEGSVYVFVRNGSGWVEEARIRPEPMTGACAISGDTIVAGAYTNDHAGFQSGSAYVYVRSGGIWTQAAHIMPEGLLPEDRFGFAVDIEGDRIVVGAPRSIPNDAPGKAYAYVRSATTWTLETLLQAPVPAGDDDFGNAVSMDGDRIAVAAPEFAVAGSCFLFQRSDSAWTFEDELTDPSIVSSAYLGWDVALSGSTVVTSALFTVPESIYVFVDGASGWSEQAVLTSENGLGFGWSLALEGDRLLVPELGADEGRPTAGYVHLLEREGSIWNDVGRFLPTDPESEGLFGSDVAIAGDTAVVGAYLDDTWGERSGAVYVFDVFAGTASNYCTATDNSAGVAARMALSGTTSLLPMDLDLHAVGTPAETTGQFFYGFETAEYAFGDGVLCVSPFAPGLIRLPPVVLTDTFGSARHTLVASEMPLGFMPATLFFQFFFRDVAAGGALFNLSDGLGITFVP